MVTACQYNTKALKTHPQLSCNSSSKSSCLTAAENMFLCFLIFRFQRQMFSLWLLHLSSPQRSGNFSFTSAFSPHLEFWPKMLLPARKEDEKCLASRLSPLQSNFCMDTKVVNEKQQTAWVNHTLQCWMYHNCTSRDNPAVPLTAEPPSKSVGVCQKSTTRQKEHSLSMQTFHHFTCESVTALWMIFSQFMCQTCKIPSFIPPPVARTFDCQGHQLIA